MVRRIVLVLFPLILAQWVLTVRAQTPSALAPASSSATPAKTDYATELAVAESLSLKVSFENDGASVQEIYLRARIQSDAGVKRYGLLTFTYQGATQTVEFDFVRVHKPDGSIVNTPADNIQDLDAGITRDAPFYSDLREKHVAVRGLSPGDTLEYKARWRTTKSLAPGQFWYEYSFEHSAIVLDEQLQISVPRERPIKEKSPSLNPVITEEGGHRVYTWKTSNLADHSKENQATKELDANLGRMAPADVQISSFQSWDEVGKWYWGLQQDRIQPNAEIRAKAAELTTGATDPTAALHSVYDFVSTKFRYIGVAFGIGRYQPHSADDVLGNQYGDCKDKHTLLASLLQASGITAYPALISSTHKLDPDVPSPAQFDHVISVVPQGKDYIWLDTTTEVGPFAYLVDVLRDKPALVIPGDKPAILLTTPADPPFRGSVSFKVDAKLNDTGVLDAKMEYSSRGDSEVVLRSAFRQVQQSEWKDLVQQISYNLGFAGTVSDTSVSSPESTGDPFHFSYAYNRKDYPDWTNHRITMPGLPFLMPQAKNDAASSNDPIWLGSPLESVSDSRVELPKGYAPELPVGTILERDYAEYHSSYMQDHGVLISQRRLLIKLHQIPAAELENYKNFLSSMYDDINRYIMLSSASMTVAPSMQDRFGAVIGAALRNLPDTPNPEAQKLEKESYSDLASDQKAAVDAMKRAVAADLKFTRGWIALGSMYMSLSQTDDGVDAFRKAIDSDPQQITSYKTLAFALVSTHREGEAIKVWQDLLKVAPDDRDATADLGRLLYLQKRYSEALPVLEADVRLNPSAVGPLSRLGLAYLKSGDPEKGLATLEEILKIDSSPLALNNVAYDLADANAKLSEALVYAEKAVREQEGVSQKTQLASLTVEDLRATRNTGSYWDTLGWVHFRLGDLGSAEQYIHSAWILSQRADVADHLGQVYEKQNKKDAAIHMYRLALWISTATQGGANHEEIEGHLSHLLPGANFSTGLDLHRGDSSGDELSEMRRVKLPRITPGRAGAEFFLLFGLSAQLEDVKFISGADELKQAGKVIRAAKFPVSFPDGSKAQVVRRGILSCSSLTGCSFVLYNPDSVTAVD